MWRRSQGGTTKYMCIDKPYYSISLALAVHTSQNNVTNDTCRKCLLYHTGQNLINVSHGLSFYEMFIYKTP